MPTTVVCSSSALEIGGLPIEELLFAAAFGAYWSGVYVDTFSGNESKPY